MRGNRAKITKKRPDSNALTSVLKSNPAPMLSARHTMHLIRGYKGDWTIAIVGRGLSREVFDAGERTRHWEIGNGFDNRI